MDRLKRLCGFGYFPNNLPRTFVSRDFGTYARTLAVEWARNGTIPSNFREAAGCRKVKETEPEIFSAPKAHRERRYFHVVHPTNHLVLSELIGRQWPTVRRWLNRSEYTYSGIDITDQGDRAVTAPDFFGHRLHCDGIAAVSDWITVTDITRFFPSIYTHSLTWAAYGKEKYKSNPKKYAGSVADLLDVSVRKCNRSQTVGIPIGPDTSAILAEIVSGRIDLEIKESTSLQKEYADRLQDDWVIGSSSLERAEQCLSELIQAYQRMGLDINGRKTSILHVGDLPSPTWRSELIAIAHKRALRGEILGALLDRAISLQVENPTESVLAYVYAMLSGVRFAGRDMRLLQNFVTRSVAVDSRVVDDACLLLLNLHHEGYHLSEDLLRARFVPLLERALEVGHQFEASWALHLMRGLRISLNDTGVSDLASSIDGSVVPLIMLDLESLNLLQGLPKSRWQKIIRSSDFWGPNWLLAYEGVRHGWLSDSNNKVSTDPFLGKLLENNIVFYDESRNVRPRDVVARERWRRLRRLMTSARTSWSASS